MTRAARGGGLGPSAATAYLLLAVCAAGCAEHYRPPQLPAEQLAVVSLDSSASVLDVDGLPVRSGGPGNQFFVGAGCRKLTAKYEQSYFIWGEKKARKAGLGGGLGAALANTEQHDYETMKPIQFFIPAKAGRRYWVTATFTGDEFLPRIVESDASGETVDKFLPDQPCKTGAPP